jgi:hypothetical protein
MIAVVNAYVVVVWGKYKRSQTVLGLFRIFDASDVL